MAKAAKKEDWMNTRWRPAMGWVYMVTCITDFILFPILWSALQAAQNGQVTSQWDPITLRGAGLFHLAMGAVLGVAAWSRGQEKLAGVAGGYSGYDTQSRYGESYGSEYIEQRPYNQSRGIVSRMGRPGPVIEEPEL